MGPTNQENPLPLPQTIRMILKNTFLESISKGWTEPCSKFAKLHKRESRALLLILVLPDKENKTRLIVAAFHQTVTKLTQGSP